MSTDDDWISASDALDLVENVLGGRAPAKDTLAELLRDELVRARAREAWGSNTSDINAIWESDNADEVEHDSEEEIQTDFRQSVQWADDVDSWRWRDSFFMVTISRRPRECIYYKGVSIYRKDLNRIRSLDQVLVAQKKSRGGRRPDLSRWHNFWMEVVQIARDGNLVPGQIASQAALREDLLHAMSGEALSEDSIKEPVRRIWQRFCED